MWTYTLPLTSDQMVNLRLALQSRADLCEDKLRAGREGSEIDPTYWSDRLREVEQLLALCATTMPTWTNPAKEDTK